MNKSIATISLMLLVGTAALGALFSPTLSAAQPSAAAYTPANAHAGEQVFLQKCFQCHSVNPGEVRIGPSLFHVMKGPKAVSSAQVRIQLRDGKGKMPPFKDLLTPEEVAGRLKVPESWVYEKTRARCRNPIPCLRLGRYVRFDWNAVITWLTAASTQEQNAARTSLPAKRKLVR